MKDFAEYFFGSLLAIWKAGDLAKQKYKTPDTASAFVDAFDDDDYVLPFTFDLPVKL